MATIEKTIDIDRPVSTVYNQWTQFEEFPNFMEGVESVTQLDDRRLHWVAEVGGRHKEWDAVINRQEPDQAIGWRSESGTENAGSVMFEPLDSGQTRVKLQMAYEPDDFVETAGDALGFVSRRVEGDLKRFKEFIEARGVESGAWRGRIRN
jgi:uncharacterized membrane protein